MVHDDFPTCYDGLGTPHKRPQIAANSGHETQVLCCMDRPGCRHCGAGYSTFARTPGADYLPPPAPCSGQPGRPGGHGVDVLCVGVPQCSLRHLYHSPLTLDLLRRPAQNLSLLRPSTSRVPQTWFCDDSRRAIGIATTHRTFTIPLAIFMGLWVPRTWRAADWARAGRAMKFTEDITHLNTDLLPSQHLAEVTAIFVTALAAWPENRIWVDARSALASAIRPRLHAGGFTKATHLLLKQKELSLQWCSSEGNPAHLPSRPVSAPAVPDRAQDAMSAVIQCV